MNSKHPEDWHCKWENTNLSIVESRIASQRPYTTTVIVSKWVWPTRTAAKEAEVSCVSQVLGLFSFEWLNCPAPLTNSTASDVTHSDDTKCLC